MLTCPPSPVARNTAGMSMDFYFSSDTGHSHNKSQFLQDKKVPSEQVNTGFLHSGRKQARVVLDIRIFSDEMHPGDVYFCLLITKGT